jgi:hypothetical protein
LLSTVWVSMPIPLAHPNKDVDELSNLNLDLRAGC